MFEKIRDYCLSLKESEEVFPFGPQTPVYKLRGKIFAIMSIDPPYSINLKGNPENIIERIEQFQAVKPGYHMNKVHWHTVELEGDVPYTLLTGWVQQSYELIKNKLPKQLKNGL